MSLRSISVWRRRAAVWTILCVAIIGSAFGTSASEQRYRFQTTIVTETLQGSDAAAFIQKLISADSAARDIREQMLAKHGPARLGASGISDVSSIVVRASKVTRATPVARVGIWGLIDSVFNAELNAQEWSQDGGTIIVSPFENDSDGNTAEFNLWFTHPPEGVQWAHDMHVNTPSYYTTDLGASEGYDDYDATVSGHTSHTMADKYWRDIPCTDRWGIFNEANRSARQHVHNALFTMGAAVGPCVGATIGWAACVGSAYWGHVLTGIIYDKMQQISACHY